MKFKMLPAHEPTVQAFLDLPGIKLVGPVRVVPVPMAFNDKMCPATAIINYEEPPTVEEQQARELDAAMAARAEDELKLAEYQRIAAWIRTTFGSNPDFGEFLNLKNALEKDIWLTSKGAARKDIPVIIEMLKPEMIETTKKLVPAKPVEGGASQ